MSTPVTLLNSSQYICGALPIPAEATHRHLAGIALGVSDQFRNTLHRKGWVYHQHAGAARNRGDRSEVADNVEIQFVIERRVPSVSRRREVKRVTVRRRFGDRFRGES